MRIDARTGNLPLGPPGLRRMALLGVVALLAGACGDDSTAMTDTADGTTTSGTTEPPLPTTTVTPTTEGIPTTTDPTTTTGPTTTTTGPITTTDPTTTTTDPTTTTTMDTDTDTDTDTTTGGELIGRSVTQTVNSGTVASSANFRMVFTMGQPTSNQGIYSSSNFRLQGGLIGANGNPP